VPGNDHPDHQLARPDRRVVAVPQQLGTHHGTRREAFLDLMVDGARDLLHVQATSPTATAFQRSSTPVGDRSLAHRSDRYWATGRSGEGGT
jgi:hypothetical protein